MPKLSKCEGCGVTLDHSHMARGLCDDCWTQQCDECGVVADGYPGLSCFNGNNLCASCVMEAKKKPSFVYLVVDEGPEWWNILGTWRNEDNAWSQAEMVLKMELGDGPGKRKMSKKLHHFWTLTDKEKPVPMILKGRKAFDWYENQIKEEKMARRLSHISVYKMQVPCNNIKKAKGLECLNDDKTEQD